jgi:negative regulator of sigma E activity
MLFLKILLLECPTIIINSLITKEEAVVIMRLKKEREWRRELQGAAAVAAVRAAAAVAVQAVTKESA